MNKEEQYMKRCLDLAAKGAGYASPNPMVGAVLVHRGRVIGEGWHERYGSAHAEVNCLQSVQESDQQYITSATLYVSLEPCAHYGKTPPCADLIIRHHIPHVVIGCRDPFSQVAGKGIQKLEEAGIRVTTGVLNTECRWLNRRFFVRQEMNRPYFILKWASSADGFLAPFNGRRVMLSGPLSLQHVHKMRSEEDAILVGFNTARLDDPRLNNRYGTGKQPVRIAYDPQMALPRSAALFQPGQSTIIFNNQVEKTEGDIQWLKLDKERPAAPQIAERLAQLPFNSVIVEGGSKTLSAFIEAGIWDECLQYRTPHLLGEGVPAPLLKGAVQHSQHASGQDTLHRFYNTSLMPYFT